MEHKSKRTRRLGLRLTEAEAQILTDQARKNYLSVSAWIRQKIFNT